MQTGNAVIGRLYQMTAMTLLFASGGYLIVLQGFLASFRLVPLTGGLNVGSVSRGDDRGDVRPAARGRARSPDRSWPCCSWPTWGWVC